MKRKGRKNRNTGKPRRPVPPPSRPFRDRRQAAELRFLIAAADPAQWQKD